MSTDWCGASSLSIRHIWLKRGCNVCVYEGFSAVYKRKDFIFSALSESVYGLICISICSFSVCVYVLSQSAP